MQFALNSWGKRVDASDARPGRYQCERCGQRAILRRPSDKSPHFAHFRRNPACPLSVDGGGDWDTGWQAPLPWERRDPPIDPHPVVGRREVPIAHPQRTTPAGARRAPMRYEESPRAADDVDSNPAAHVLPVHRVVRRGMQPDARVSADAATSVLIRCPACSWRNRTDVDRIEIAVCGHCGADLPALAAHRYNARWLIAALMAVFVLAALWCAKDPECSSRWANLATRWADLATSTNEEPTGYRSCAVRILDGERALPPIDVPSDGTAGSR